MGGTSVWPTAAELGLIAFLVVIVFATNRLSAIGDLLGRLWHAVAARLRRRRPTV